MRKYLWQNVAMGAMACLWTAASCFFAADCFAPGLANLLGGFACMGFVIFDARTGR